MPPNMATCSLTARFRGPDPGKAASIVDERVTSVLAKLNSQRIAANDVESSHVDKQVVPDEGRNSEAAAIRGYDVSRQIKFTAHQLDSLPSIEVSLIGSTNVANINCQFDRTDRATIEADLLTKATQSAKAQADKLVEPLGRHVTSAVAVSKVPFYLISGSLGLSSAYGEYAGRMFKKSVADELLIPSTIHLSAAVNVLSKME
jgi:uncharacterized protein YggE